MWNYNRIIIIPKKKINKTSPHLKLSCVHWNQNLASVIPYVIWTFNTIMFWFINKQYSYLTLNFHQATHTLMPRPWWMQFWIMSRLVEHHIAKTRDLLKTPKLTNNITQEDVQGLQVRWNKTTQFNTELDIQNTTVS